MLTLQYLTRQCQGRSLFDGFGITLLPGCLLRLDGENGSGKTILLELIAGKQLCPKGSILFAGEETRGDKQFFSETCYLSADHSDLTLRWPVEKQLNHWAKKGEPEVLSAVIHYFELTPLLKRCLKTLSPGERQRVRLARLMLQPATIWLLDRPFMFLDEATMQRAEAFIASRCQQNGIVIFTHDGQTRLNPHHVLALP